MGQIQAWRMHWIDQPMTVEQIPAPSLAPDEVLIKVSGCGVCHTDLGFLYDGIKTVKSLPLTLGHEISGFVGETGSSAKDWLGKAVIVPAVLPCGECHLCLKGRSTICRKQRMPGNHIDGGFASHVVVPSRYLCPVEVNDETTPVGDSGVTLREISVVADAVTTPYQAVKNSDLAEGDVAIFIGVGGIGGYGVQIAKALGAFVVAIDIDERKLQLVSQHGAEVTFNAKKLDKKEIRGAIRNLVSEESLSSYEWKIFETSGTKAGQELAYSLLTFGATLSVVGFTMEQVEIRLSNLMAYDARAIGNWGCLPEHYPAVLELVAQGRVKLAPFVEIFPLSEINTVFERVHRRELAKRPILVPDFGDVKVP